MFNKTKLIQVSKEIYEKGYAISPSHVAGVLTIDKPIGSRKNFFLKIINAGRYSRKHLFMSVVGGKIYCFPYRKEKPDYENMWEITPDMIVDKSNLLNGFFNFKVMKDGVINTIFAFIGTVLPDAFTEEFTKIMENAK
jgi:hypothetical protein